MKTVKKYEVERIRPICDHKTSIKRLTGDISGRYGLFIETIWNSYEHGGANHIWITVAGRGASYEVTIVDDGKGMDSYRRQRSLNMAMTAEVQTGRNYQDLGLKRLAADFQRAKVYTISAEEKEADPEDFPMWVMEYDFEKLFDILAVNAEEVIMAKPRRPDWKQMELPESSTGVKIHLTGSREDRPRFSADKLRREMSSCLPPRIAEKVYINGQPLEQRQIVGEPFRMTVDDHPKLGRVELDLYIPKVKSTRDQLMVGAFQGIRDWRTFCQEIPEEVLGDRLNILSDGIFGEIHIEAFKTFETASRRDFEVNLFVNPLISHFVDFMEHEVCAELEHLLGVVKQAEISERDKRLLNELTKYVSVLGGEESRNDRFNVLTLDITSIEVLPNQRQPVNIKVDKHNPDLTIKWDVSVCGGRTEISHDGRYVKYWPGSNVGGYDLVCYYEEEPKTKARVDISIVSQKLLRVHPQRVTVHPGRAATLTAMNWKDDSSGEEHLRWRLDTDDIEGRFIVTVRGEKQERETGYGSEAVYRAGYKLGTYRVELYDSKNRRKVAYSDVTVIEPSERQKKDKDGEEDDVIIEGARYQVGFEYMEAYPGMSRLYAGSGKKQIRINRCHPGCKHAEKRRGDDGLLELALGQLLLQHIDEQSRATGEQLTMEEKTRRFADLYAVIVEKYEKRGQ